MDATFCPADKKDGQSGPERESQEPKQRDVDEQGGASWPQQPPRLTAPAALKS